MKYALIGEKLGHSFSKIIHNLCGLEYDLIELNKDQVENFVKSSTYDGFNVTIPYKKQVMEYLDEISPLARLVGSVNTVKREGNKLVGYNTDVSGLEYQIECAGASVKDKNVLILGSGGASLTAIALCKKNGAKSYKIVSRSGEVNYENCYNYKQTEVIINTTPVGMYPNVDGVPIDIERFSKLTAVFDLIYNPIRTKLILRAEKMGLKCSGGLKMLIMQGVKSQEIWLGEKKDPEIIENLFVELTKTKNNLVLSGMAGSGKTSIGKECAKLLNLPFYDVDKEIELKYGKSPSEIILSQGEEVFRDIETKVVLELSKTGGKVISLGGGSILREENVNALKQNGIIVYIERDIEKLVDKDRPLSQKFGIRELFEKRKGIYESTFDRKVENNQDLETAVKGVIKEYEIACYQRS